MPDAELHDGSVMTSCLADDVNVCLAHAYSAPHKPLEW